LTHQALSHLLALAIVFGLSVWPAQGNAQEAADAKAAAHDEHEHIGHKGGVNTDPTEIKTDLAIFTFVVFLLLCGILWRFAWEPVSKALEAREKHIHEELASAERANAESKRLLAEHEKKMADVQLEVRAIIDEARRDAQHTQQEILKQAQAEAQATRERAVRDIEQARDHALQELFHRSADIATEMAGQIVRRSLNPQDHRDLVAKVIQELPGRN
jgi:F-type H+-transporting ATPase subunit b